MYIIYVIRRIKFYIYPKFFFYIIKIIMVDDSNPVTNRLHSIIGPGYLRVRR